MTLEIHLAAMRFHALVGILPNERVTPQPIEVDVDVVVGPGDGIVDYRDVYNIVAGVVRAGPIDFLEEICERVARGTLSLSQRARSVKVAVRKPHVALGGPLDYAEVVFALDAGE